MHYVHKKARCGPEIATFRTKTPCFLWVICLNWLAKIELRGTRTPGLQYCCWLYCCKRKMLKRNWNWRNYRLFCHIFVIGEISIGEGADPLSLPLGYAYAPNEENKKGARKFSGRFLAFSNEISTVQKIVLSSSRGQGNFRGLEASRPRPRTWPSRPRPRTSKCVLEDVLEAKDVLEDSTSGNSGYKKARFFT